MIELHLNIFQKKFFETKNFFYERYLMHISLMLISLVDYVPVEMNFDKKKQKISFFLFLFQNFFRWGNSFYARWIFASFELGLAKITSRKQKN